MRQRRGISEEVTETARRRLEVLTAELALLRDEPGDPSGGSFGQPPPEELPTPAAARDQVADLGRPGPDRPGPDGEGRPGRHARRPVALAGRLGGWLHDRLPATLQGRVGLGPASVAVVAVFVAAGFAVTAWWVVRADGAGEVVPPRTWGGEVEPAETAQRSDLLSQAASATKSPDDAVEEPGEIVVDVTGKVRHRGIVTLPLGSRVVDALEAAGGPRQGVSLVSLNLARVLVDGEQIVVGVPQPGGVAAGAVAAPGADGSGDLVNINMASQAELEELPGIGPVTAGAIIAWRTENGAFSSVEELLEVSGIGDARLADIAPHVTL